MNAEAFLKFFYPFLFVSTDNRYIDAEQIAIALNLASAHSPSCLSDDEKAQAEAHYAAYILGTIVKNKLSGGGSEVVDLPTGAVKAIKDGDSEWQYYQATTGEQTNADFSGGLSTAYDKYEELAKKCGVRLRTVRI